MALRSRSILLIPGIVLGFQADLFCQTSRIVSVPVSYELRSLATLPGQDFKVTGERLTPAFDAPRFLNASFAPSFSPLGHGLGVIPTSPSKTPDETRFRRYLRAPLWETSGLILPGGSADLRSGMRPPGFQGKRNTCSVFAAASLGEYLIRQSKDEDVKISESFLYYNAKLNFTNSPELAVYKEVDGLGGFVAVEALQGGFVEERFWPYRTESAGPRRGNGKTKADAALPDFRKAQEKIRKRMKKIQEQAFEEPDGRSSDAEGTLDLTRIGSDPLPSRALDTGKLSDAPPSGIERHIRKDYRFMPVAIDRREIKNFLVEEGKPVVFNIMVYFDAVDPSTGRIRNPTDGERKRCLESNVGCGGHVILITGYDPAAREYVFRNSWGSSWGDGGYGRISESYVINDCEVCSHLKDLPSLSDDNKSMVVNGSHGWSAFIE